MLDLKSILSFNIEDQNLEGSQEPKENNLRFYDLILCIGGIISLIIYIIWFGEFQIAVYQASLLLKICFIICFYVLFPLLIACSLIFPPYKLYFFNKLARARELPENNLDKDIVNLYGIVQDIDIDERKLAFLPRSCTLSLKLDSHAIISLKFPYFNEIELVNRTYHVQILARAFKETSGHYKCKILQIKNLDTNITYDVLHPKLSLLLLAFLIPIFYTPPIVIWLNNLISVTLITFSFFSLDNVSLYGFLYFLSALIIPLIISIPVLREMI